MSSSIQRHHTNARMSKIVQHAGLVYLCGQTSSGSPAHDVTEQSREVLARIDRLLSEVGTDRSRILTATIYLKSIADFAAMNAVWESWITEGSAPARTTVEAALAAENLLVEISVTAAS